LFAEVEYEELSENNSYTSLYGEKGTTDNDMSLKNLSEPYLVKSCV